MSARPKSTVASYIAPTRGLYVGENVADQREAKGRAIVLDNWFPEQDDIRARRGSQEFATDIGEPVETLVRYLSGATEEHFAIAGGAIFDVSASGAVGSAVHTGLTASRCQTATITTSGGTTYVALVNGADDRLVYDGSSWSTSPAITGVDSDTLSDVWVHRNRIFFAQKDSLQAWYLPVDSVGGAAAAFNLGGVFQRGGALLAGATWSTEDSGAGLDDKCVFISTLGEAAVYSGSNPGNAADWSLQGVYQLGRPLGRDCFMKAGGDLVVMTEDGMIPLSQAIVLAEEALAEKAVTRPIAPLWTQAVQARSDREDEWQVTLWKRESMAVITIPPLDGGEAEQFVANVVTGAWARYVGWRATCFGVYQNRLFFGTADGRVVEAEVGGTDDGLPYSCAVAWPFSAMRDAASFKMAHAARPIMQSSITLAPEVRVMVDYLDDVPPPPGSPSTSGEGAVWGVAIWGVDVWPGVSRRFSEWQAVEGLGSALSPVLQITVEADTTPDLRLSRLDFLYESGGAVV